MKRYGRCWKDIRGCLRDVPDYVRRVGYTAFNTGLWENTVKLQGSLFTNGDGSDAPRGESCSHSALTPLYILKAADSPVTHFICIYIAYLRWVQNFRPPLPRRKIMAIIYILWNFLVATFTKGKFKFNNVFYFSQYVQNIISTCHHYNLLISSIQFSHLRLWNLLYILYWQNISVLTRHISNAQDHEWLVAVALDSTVFKVYPYLAAYPDTEKLLERKKIP